MKISKKGFTIIELLVVIAIIAILTAIITANFTQSRAKARDAKRVFDLSQIQVALELFFDRCNGYPASVSTSATLASCPSGVTLGTFITKIPSPPLASEGASYNYSVNSATPATDYVLKTVLEYNNSVLTDSSHSNFSSMNPATDCTAALAYCVQPK